MPSSKQLLLSKLSPPVHRQLNALDRSLFSLNIPILALKVPACHASCIRKSLQGYIIDLPRVKSLVPDPNSSTSRLVLLDLATDTAPDVLEPIQSIVAGLDLSWDVQNYTLNLNYEYWTADQILKSILPDDAEVISSFESIGDIAHMNLRDDILPFRKMIGQIILDKNPRMATVVNKTSNIHTQFRTFPLEILATRNPAHSATQLHTQVIENGITFKLNYADVYWNSRLHTEHHRLLTTYFKPGDLIADVMCGIGPFALPAAKFFGCPVIANDLNPESFRWLVHNIHANHLISSPPLSSNSQAANHLNNSSSIPLLKCRSTGCAGYVKPFNMCGREFIRGSTALLNGIDGLFETDIRPIVMDMALNERQQAETKEAKGKDCSSHTRAADQHESKLRKWATLPVKTYTHYIMNLPASALGYLDGFHGMWAHLQTQRDFLRTVCPTVHVYCFTRAAFINRPQTDSEQEAIDRDVRRRIHQVLGADPIDLVVHRVRLVAPRKDMCCATFRVPEQVLFGESKLGNVDVELHFDHHIENVVGFEQGRISGGSELNELTLLSSKIKRPRDDASE